MPLNGYLTDGELAYVDNGQRLRRDVAPRYLAMIAAAARDGVTIRTTEGYRDYATQVYLYNGWIARLPGFNNASQPGFSPHGLGLASDLNTTGFGGTVYNWLKANAANFGFDNNVGISIDEHWHWVYNGGGALGTAGSATAHTLGDNDMAILTRYTGPNTNGVINGHSFLIGQQYIQVMRDDLITQGGEAVAGRREDVDNIDRLSARLVAAGIPEKIVRDGKPIGTLAWLEQGYQVSRYWSAVEENKGAGGGSTTVNADFTETNSKIDAVGKKIDAIKFPTKITGTLGA